MRLTTLIIVALLTLPAAASAATITFVDLGSGVSFTSDDPLITPVDCAGTTLHCVVQRLLTPADYALFQCTGACTPAIADPLGTTVRDILTTTFGGGQTGEPFARFGFYAEKLPGLYVENGNFGQFPPGTVGFGTCQDYYQGCAFSEDGLLHPAFTWSYYGQSANLSPPFPLLGFDTIRFRAADVTVQTAPVPEPASLLVLGTGLMALWPKFRRQTRPEHRSRERSR